MAARVTSRGSSDGVDGAILETGVGSTGTVLEAGVREARRRKAEVGNVTLGAGTVQSCTTGTQAGFRRRRTLGEADGGPGTDTELCARCRAAFVADGNAQEVPVEVRSGVAAEPSVGSSGRGPH